MSFYSKVVLISLLLSLSLGSEISIFFSEDGRRNLSSINIFSNNTIAELYKRTPTIGITDVLSIGRVPIKKSDTRRIADIPICTGTVVTITRGKLSDTDVVRRFAKKSPIVDLRGRPPYQYCRMNYRVATLPQFRYLMLEFDLKIKTVDQGFLRSHVLIFESPSAQLTLYLNGWTCARGCCRNRSKNNMGEFGIVHYNKQIGNMTENQPVLRINLSFVPLRTVRGFNHFIVRIIDKDKITVDLDGSSFSEPFARTIYPQNETMNVWLDVIPMELSAHSAIKNLVIKTM